MADTTPAGGPRRVPKPRTPAKVLGDVTRTSERINRLTAELEELYAKRIALYHEGKALPEPTTHAALAAAAGLGEDAVTGALRKDRLRRAEAEQAKQ